MPTPGSSLFGIPPAKAQEFVSVAYVRAIVAQAGLNTKTYDWDDGLDLDVGSKKPAPDGRRYPNVWVNLQIKSTSRWRYKDDSLEFWLDRDAYDDLRSVLSPTNQYLVLYTMHHARCSWITHGRIDPSSPTTFSWQAYYLKLTGLPEIKPFKNGRPRAGKTLRIPIANRFTAAAARRMYFDAVERARVESESRSES